MKKWGRQGFLNPVDSHDSGSFKFSIRPHSVDRTRGNLAGPFYSDKFQINDCGSQIVLDFGVTNGIYEGDNVDQKRIQKARLLKEIKDRRAKVRTLRKAVDDFADALEANLDEIEARARAVK